MIHRFRIQAFSPIHVIAVLHHISNRLMSLSQIGSKGVRVHDGPVTTVLKLLKLHPFIMFSVTSWADVIFNVETVMPCIG